MVSLTVIVVLAPLAFLVSVATKELFVEPGVTVTRNESPLSAVNPPEYPASEACKRI